MANRKWGIVEIIVLKECTHFVCWKKNVHDHKNDDDNDEWNEIVITAHKICSSFFTFYVHMKSYFPKLNEL